MLYRYFVLPIYIINLACNKLFAYSCLFDVWTSRKGRRNNALKSLFLLSCLSRMTLWETKLRKHYERRMITLNTLYFNIRIFIVNNCISIMILNPIMTKLIIKTATKINKLTNVTTLLTDKHCRYPYWTMTTTFLYKLIFESKGRFKNSKKSALKRITSIAISLRIHDSILSKQVTASDVLGSRVTGLCLN